MKKKSTKHPTKKATKPKFKIKALTPKQKAFIEVQTENPSSFTLVPRSSLTELTAKSAAHIELLTRAFKSLHFVFVHKPVLEAFFNSQPALKDYGASQLTEVENLINDIEKEIQ